MRWLSSPDTRHAAAAQAPFNDLFKGSAGPTAEWPPLAGEDGNGFPLAINPQLDQCAAGSLNYLGDSCSYWVPGGTQACCCRKRCLQCVAPDERARGSRSFPHCEAAHSCRTTHLRAGRHHFVSSSKIHGTGTYALVVKGLGTFSLSYDAPAGTVQLPNSYTRFTPSGPVTIMPLQVTVR